MNPASYKQNGYPSCGSIDLLAWHEAEPIGEWERHRNSAIFEIQGNRNPLIDNPQWASRIPFQTAFGTPGG